MKAKTFEITYTLPDGATFSHSCQGLARPGHYPSIDEIREARQAAGIVLPSAPPGQSAWSGYPKHAWNSRAGYVMKTSTTIGDDSGLLYTTQVKPRAV